MIRSANHSSFPRVGESPLDQVLRTTLSRFARGAATEQEVDEAVEETTTICVAQQGRAFVDIVTDGMVRWDGPLSHLCPHLDGVQAGPLARWFDTNFYQRRLDVVGAIRRPKPFLVADYELALGVALNKPVKVILPGPVTCARSARDAHYGSVEALALALAAALAEESADLAAAGATIFQLDEPLLCRHPGDLDLVARAAAIVFEAAGAGTTTILSTYFGNLAPIAAELQRLPGTHLGLDMVCDAGNWELLAHLPRDRGLCLGLFEARSTLQEDAADVAGLLEPHKDTLLERDLIVGPNAGLELLPRDAAFDKLLHSRYLVEKLNAEWT